MDIWLIRAENLQPTPYGTALKVKTIVETYPLAEAANAYERVAEGRARFRAVLTM